jgi:hypothetical protein
MTGENETAQTWRHRTMSPESAHEGEPLEKLLEKVKAAAVTIVAGSTDHLPMIWFAEHGDGTLAAYITDMEGNERDEEKLEILKEQFRKMDVRRYVCVAESWLATVSDRDDFREMRPSERPDRREVVFFIAVERGRRLNVMAEIERTNTGRRLKSFDSFDGRGWMAEMLPDDD